MCVTASCGLRQERQESAQQWRLRSRRLPQSRHGLRLRRLIYRRLRLHQHRRRRRCLRPRRLQSAKPQVTSRLPQRAKVQGVGVAEYHVCVGLIRVRVSGCLFFKVRRFL